MGRENLCSHSCCASEYGLEKADIEQGRMAKWVHEVAGMLEQIHEAKSIHSFKQISFMGGITEICFLTDLEAGRSRLRCWQGGFPLRPPSLVCRWLPSHYFVLTW